MSQSNVARASVADVARVPLADAVQWLLVATSLAWTLVINPVFGLQPVTRLFLFALAFLMIHGIRRYGVRAFLVFLVVTYVVSNAYENFSILYGFPFGHYHYTGWPKIFLVPVTIGPFYIAIGYLSWQTANVLLGIVDRQLHRRPNVVLLPVIAAAVMTMFDLTTDPDASTVNGAWIWERGGGYFGVPASNFMGWWLVTYTFFQIFAIYLRRSQTTVPHPQHSRDFFLQPVLLYLNLGLGSILQVLLSAPEATPLIAPNGIHWRHADINEAMMTVFLFTMCVVAVLAFARLFTEPGKEVA